MFDVTRCTAFRSGPPGRMRRALTLSGALLLSCSGHMLAQTPDWSRITTAGCEQGAAWSSGLAIDEDGGSYVSIGFDNVLKLGSLSVERPGMTGTVIAKLDRDGTPVWWNRIDCSNWATGSGVDLGADGRVYTALSFRGNLQFGSTTINNTAPMYDVAVACYTGEGSLAWARAPISGGVRSVAAVKAAPGGGCIVFGSFGDSITIGSHRLRSVGEFDAYLARFDASGEVVWARAFGGAGMEVAAELAVDPSGRIVTVGLFDREMRLGDLSVSGDAEHDHDMFIALLDGDGAPVRLAKEDGARQILPDGVAIAADGSFYVTGVYPEAGLIAGREMPEPLWPGGNAAFLAAYDRDATPRWIHPVMTATMAQLNDVSVAPGAVQDGGGSVFVTGYFGETLRIGGAEVSSRSAGDLVVACFSPDGTLRWMRSGGGYETDNGLLVRGDATGGCRVVGRMENSEGQESVFGPFTLQPSLRNPVLLAWIEPVAGVACQAEDAAISLLPNPTSGRALLRLGSADAGAARVEVVDALGRLRAVPFDGRAGAISGTVEIRTDELEEGVYFCRVVVGDDVRVMPLVVRR